MKKFKSFLSAAAIIVATSLVALGIGVLVAYGVLILEKRGRWEQLATPPGQVVGLLAGEEEFVLVETAGGSTYEIFCPAGAEDYPCLRQVEAPDTFSESESTCDNQQFPQPSGQVEQRLLSCIEYEYFIWTQYVLRADGTVWRWQARVYPYGQVVRFLQIVILATVTGAFLGLLIVIFREK